MMVRSGRAHALMEMNQMNSIGKNIEGQYVILKDEYCSDRDKKNEEMRVYLAGGGFGCSPVTSGTCVTATQIATSLRMRLEGYMLDRIATPEEVDAAKEFFSEHPPRDMTFNEGDIQYREGKSPIVVVTEPFSFEVKIIGYKTKDKSIELPKSIGMTYEGIMNSYLGFVIRDIRHAIKENQDVDVDKIREHMVEFSKGFLGDILNMMQFPIEMKVDLTDPDMTPERRQEHIENMSTRSREFYDTPIFDGDE